MKMIKKPLALLLFVVLLFSNVTAYAASYQQGIDVSRHNESVDFVTEKDNSTKFVMIRLGYFNHLDEQFWNNVKSVCNAGMHFGVYLYSYAYDLEEAQTEADFTVNTLSEMPEEYKKYFTMPVALDMEESKIAANGKEQTTAQAVLYCDAIKSAGYTPMVYANLNWFTNYLDLNTLVNNDYKLWYAKWEDNPDFSKTKEIGDTGVYADIWQYCSGSNHSTGIDRNIAYDSVVNHQYITNITKATTSKNGKTEKVCSICGSVASSTTIYYPKTISLSTTPYTYNGNVRKPVVTVKDSKGNTLKNGTDYTLTYASGRKNVGKYSVKVTFKGNYSGSKTLYFTIKPKSTSLSSATSKKKGFTVKWKKQSTQVSGYQIQYSTSSKFTNAKTKTISGASNTSRTVSNLSYKKYYVRVRTYKTVNGTNYYSAWSGYKSVKVK